MTRFPLALVPLALVPLALALSAALVTPLALAVAQTQSADTPAAASPASPELKTPTGAGAPNLVVATVKLDGGWRASKLIGASVYDDANHQVGTVDDLIISGPDKIAVAILSVGGFLGIGSKLVAVPYDHLHYDPTVHEPKVIMPGASKDSLNQMPQFTYGNG